MGAEPHLNSHAVDVLLVDNRTLVREGLCALIAQEPDPVVVAQAASVREAGGKTFLQPSLGIELASWHRARSLALSPKKEQVPRLLALGHTNAEVAHLCGMGPRTAPGPARREIGLLD
jgi:DNA-binding NarL/FixJ family response regulator